MSHTSHASHSSHGSHTSHVNALHSDHVSHSNSGFVHSNSGSQGIIHTDRNTGAPLDLTNPIPIIYIYKTGSGTFTPPTGVTSIKVLVVGGGGGGGSNMGGGGGAGGAIYNAAYSVTPGTPISWSVGPGGAGSPGNVDNTTNPQIRGTNGSNSTFGTITCYGGGGGGSGPYGGSNGSDGGSGGGASGYVGVTPVANGGAGVAGQGYRGGNQLTAHFGCGGGGAGGIGTDANNKPDGGIGLYCDILGTGYYWAGGGGGSTYSGTQGGNGGNGGGGGGSIGTTTGGSGYNPGLPGGGGVNVSEANKPGGAGGINTGGGGGGGSHYNYGNRGGDGGSGVVIISYADPITTGWTNWSTTLSSGDLVNAGINKIKELRDKLVWLQQNKGQYTTFDTNKGMYVPSNPTIDVSGAADAKFISGILIDDVIYDSLKDSDDILYTTIDGSASGLPVKNIGDVLYASDVVAVKNSINSLAALDKSSSHSSHTNTTSTHSNHGNHTNHASHASHTNHGNHGSTSDERLKNNICELKNALDIISKIRAVEYKWNETKFGSRKYKGFIAQEIEKIFPEWVEEIDGIKHIEIPTFEFEAIIVKALQEQQNMINLMGEKIDSVIIRGE